MIYGSLFSGVGGFDLGLDCAGWVPAWQVEIDDQCRQVLRRHWPDVPKHEDVSNVGPDVLRRVQPEGEREADTEGGNRQRRLRGGDADGRDTERAGVDLICGGFPCQDLSVAGDRAGLDGDRSGLFYEFMRIVESLTPRWVLIENVPGLLSSNGGRDMGAVVGTLADLGYGWAYRVLDSQYFGVPQRRRRVFIVGCLGAASPAFRVLFPLGEGLPGDPPPEREPRQVSASLLASGAGTSRPAGIGSEADFVVLDRASFNQGKNAKYDPKIEPSETTPPLVARGPGAVARQRAYRISCHREGRFKETKKSNPLTGNADRSRAAPLVLAGDQAGAEVAEDKSTTLNCNKGSVPISFHENQRGEVNVSDRSYALPGGGGKPGQGYAAALVSVPRRLTPLECERLQGFPDDWTAWGVDEDGEKVEMANTPRYKMMGNAVTVNVAHWIGRRIREVHHGG